MGTKNNPGKFDCYEAAEPDEPMFVLLARDRLAPDLVRIWAYLRKGDVDSATLTYAHLIGLRTDLSAVRQKDHDKHEEAVNCAADMDAWRTRDDL